MALKKRQQPKLKVGDRVRIVLEGSVQALAGEVGWHTDLLLDDETNIDYRRRFARLHRGAVMAWEGEHNQYPHSFPPVCNGPGCWRQYDKASRAQDDDVDRLFCSRRCAARFYGAYGPLGPRIPVPDFREARCNPLIADLFFPDESGQYAEWADGRPAVVHVCNGCPIKASCLEYITEWEASAGSQPGVWAGLTERQRKVARA